LGTDKGPGTKGWATETHVAASAFKAEQEGRAEGLPIAAECAAANESAVQVGAPRMLRYDPRRDSAARIRHERRLDDRTRRAETVLAEIGETSAIAFMPCAAGVTTEIAPSPAEGRCRCG